MCGRFVMISDMSDIVDEFNIDQIATHVGQSYNIAPGARVAAVIRDDVTKLVSLQWGFVPSWAREASRRSKPINARAETVAQKPSFRDAFKNRRCLIIADGYYEWKVREKGQAKIPFYMHLKSRKPVGLAGIYERWVSPGGEQVPTCAIITTEPNDLVRPIHTRMPVIIPKEKESLWLESALSKADALCDLMRPFPAEDMDAHPVSTMVNSPVINDPRCIIPVDTGGFERV